MRAGDVVFHRPSGEEWLVAVVDGNDVYPCGELTVGKIWDCETLETADNQTFLRILGLYGGPTPDTFDPRVEICKKQLNDWAAKGGVGG